MSDDNKFSSGKHKHNSPLPLNNPEIPSKADWWDDLCKAHGAKNVWKKQPKKKKNK